MKNELGPRSRGAFAVDGFPVVGMVVAQQDGQVQEQRDMFALYRCGHLDPLAQPIDHGLAAEAVGIQSAQIAGVAQSLWGQVVDASLAGYGLVHVVDQKGVLVKAMSLEDAAGQAMKVD